MKFSVLALAAALALPLAACGGAEQPAVQEARVEEARLKEFVPLLPPAPKGFAVAGGPQFKTGDDKSTVTQIYQAPAGDAFSVEITFSNAEVDKFQKMIDEPRDRNKAGADLKDVAGRTALTFNARTATNAQYVMVVSPSRMVSVTPLFGETIKPIMSFVFENTDFDAIAAK